MLIFRRSWLAPAAILLCLFVGGSVACGKRKPPQPPVPKVAQRAEISGFQRGDRVIISWNMPAANAPAGDVRHIKRVDVYRLAERLNSPLTLSEEEFARRSVQVASVPVNDNDFGSKKLTYTDTLQFAGQAARLRYAVRFVNASGQKAAFSNFLVIEPDAKVAAAPADLKTTVTQESIDLDWAASEANADGTRPVNLVGYNIYRSESRDKAGTLLNKAPVTDTKYSDTTFEFGKEYFYFVRAVSSGGGTQTESGESNIANVTAEDTFPPTAPASITIAASPDTISLFFPPNPEPDVVGYKIFRSEDESAPKAEWKLLTPKPQEANTFQDNDVEAGKTYYYFVIAVDKFGNESDGSEVVSDTVQSDERQDELANLRRADG